MTGRSSLLFKLLLAITLFAIPALACEFSASTAKITNAVMAEDVTGDNFDPVGVTVTYAEDQPEFHAVVSISNAPSDTVLKAVWVTVDVGDAAAPNTTIDETEVTVDGSRNVDFTLAPSSGGWPPGSYKVDIYLNNSLDRTLTFGVESESGETSAAPTATPAPPTTSASTSTPAPTATSAPTSMPVVENPTAQPSPTPGNAAGIIADAVMATDVTVLTSAPIGVTDIFPPDQSIVHTVVSMADAPGDTRVKAAWTAIDVGDAAPPNTALGDYELTVQGSRNADFTFQAGGDGFPPGTYQVDIYLNDSLERTLNFTIAEQEADVPEIPTPTFAPVGSCPPLPQPDYQPSGFVRSIIMAQSTQGDNYEPVNPGRVFPPDAPFHAVVATENVPENTEVTALWYVQDVGSAEPCNMLITDPFTLETSGSRNLDFTLQPPPGVQWPEGWYRVEVYTNGNLDLDITFSVE